VDIKTKSVHFFVQRSNAFTLNNVAIPFEIERLNMGGAMNLVTGVFTVPLDGIYHFEFSAMKLADELVNVIFLQVNGVEIGTHI